MRGRRAGLLIEELKKCGYKNTHNCENPTRLWQALPDLPRTGVANTISPYDSEDEIRALMADGACLVDVRDPEEIETHKDAFQGHINIPVSVFDQFSSRFILRPQLLGRDGFAAPIVVYCRSGRRAALCKAQLDKCGFTNVHNGQNPERIHAAVPELEQVGTPHTMSPFVSAEEIRQLVEEEGALVIDCREVHEIESHGDAIEGHVNIPWTSFGQYASRLHGDLIGAGNRPMLLYCMGGRRAGLLLNALEQSGYNNLFNGKNIAHIKEALPNIPLVEHANLISPLLAESEMEVHTKSGNVTFLDCQEPEEISKDGSVEGHINIPWSTFGSALCHENVQAVIGVDLSKPIFVYCSVGWRSGFMKKELESAYGYQNVFNVKNAKSLLAACPSLQLTHTPNTVHI